MTYKDLGITAQQYANIERLISYASRTVPLPVQFDMASYSYSCEPDKIHKPQHAHCGTSACFAGLGPWAGIKVSKKDNDWLQYIERVFGVVSHSAKFSWLFSSCWGQTYEINTEDIHNTGTVQAAVTRAKIYLERGVPEEFTGNYEEFDANGKYLPCLQN